MLPWNSVYHLWRQKSLITENLQNVKTNSFVSDSCRVISLFKESLKNHKQSSSLRRLQQYHDQGVLTLIVFWGELIDEMREAGRMGNADIFTLKIRFINSSRRTLCILMMSRPLLDKYEVYLQCKGGSAMTTLSFVSCWIRKPSGLSITHNRNSRTYSEMNETDEEG